MASSRRRKRNNNKHGQLETHDQPSLFIRNNKA
jgi:hypothetical protein